MEIWKKMLVGVFFWTQCRVLWANDTVVRYAATHYLCERTRTTIRGTSQSFGRFRLIDAIRFTNASESLVKLENWYTANS